MKLNSFVYFDGNCEEAMKTYAGILGGEVVATMRYEDMPGEQSYPPGMDKKVAFSRLVADEAVLMGSDCQGPYMPMQGVCIAINVAEPEKAESAYNALLEGGSTIMPISETFWAHKFGLVADRFGVQWMINCEKSDWA